MIVGDGGGLDNHGRLGEMTHYGFAHFGGGPHVDDFDALGLRQRDGSRYQDHACAAGGRSFRQRVAHFAAGAIGEISHRVERFSGLGPRR